MPARLQGHLTTEQELALSALRARFPESAAFHSDFDLLRCLRCNAAVPLTWGPGHPAALAHGLTTRRVSNRARLEAPAMRLLRPVTQA